MRNPVTLAQVARKAGVAISTASMVLNDRPNTRISAATQQRVRHAARELGYRPRSARTRPRLHLVVGGVSAHPEPFENLAVVAAMQAEAARANATVQVVIVGQTAAAQREALEALVEGRCDGLLVATRLEPEGLDWLLSRRVPVVLVGAAMADPRCTSVHSDNYQGSGLLMDHLLRLGHRRIAFCGSCRDMTYEQQRYQCYVARCLEIGVVPAPHWVYWERESQHSLEEWVARLAPRRREPECTAIFADQVQLGERVWHALRRQGYRVPEEMSLVVFEEMRLGTPEAHPFTRVRCAPEAIARLAVIRLLLEIATPDLPRVRMVLPTDFAQGTTAAPPPDSAVATEGDGDRPPLGGARIRAGTR